MNHCSQDQQCVCVCVSLTSSGILQGGCISRLIFLKWKMRTYAIKSPRMTTQATGTTTATEISAWFNSCSGKNTQKRQFMKKITFFWTKKPKKFHVDPSEEEENNMKKERKDIQEKKNPSEKKNLFSLNIVKKNLNFFTTLKKNSFPRRTKIYKRNSKRVFLSWKNVFAHCHKKKIIFILFFTDVKTHSETWTFCFQEEKKCEINAKKNFFRQIFSFTVSH